MVISMENRISSVLISCSCTIHFWIVMNPFLPTFCAITRYPDKNVCFLHVMMSDKEVCK